MFTARELHCLPCEDKLVSTNNNKKLFMMHHTFDKIVFSFFLCALNVCCRDVVLPLQNKYVYVMCYAFHHWWSQSVYGTS